MTAPPFTLAASPVGGDAEAGDGRVQTQRQGPPADGAVPPAVPPAAPPAAPPPPPAVQINSPVVQQVDFLNSHIMAPYGGDNRANPTWVTGAADHAAAYSINTNPDVNARIVFGAGTTIGAANTATVRVKEGATILGQQAGVPITAQSIQVNHLNLAHLPLSDAVRATTRTLQWEISLDGATWINLGLSGSHLLYWIAGAPRTSAQVTNFAIDKATTYINGGADLAGAIRTGIRGQVNYNPADPINPDPLTVYNDGVGICADFANLLTLVAQSVGLNANTVMFYGGFESLGKSVWMTTDANFPNGNPSFTNLTNTRALDNSYHPGGGAAGWDFNYHAISRIEGQLHDAALNRPGYDAQAFHQGKIVRFLEFDGGGLPNAQVGAAYHAAIPRRDHTVQVTLREYGDAIQNATFGDVLPLRYPAAQASPIEVPVGWFAPNLPAGLMLNALGQITGTPTTAGNANIAIASYYGALNNSANLTLNVNP